MWATIGDATNTVLLWLTLFYLIAGIGHIKDWWDLKSFGSNWAEDGFCLCSALRIDPTCVLPPMHA